MGEVVRINSDRIEKLITEVHKQFAAATKWERARIRAGQLLNELRKRIETGEAGDGVNWWKWYSQNIARSKKDGMKVMKLASALDPIAAHDNEKAKKKKSSTGERSPTGDQSEVEDEDLVTHALRLVEEMNANQRQLFFAELRRTYVNARVG